MNDNLRMRCEGFIANRNIVKQAFRYDSSEIYPVCANIFTARGLRADLETLTRCKALIKEKTGIFSNFRGNVRAPIACLLAVNENPSAMMDETLACYDLLNGHFFGSEYLALVAFLLADMAQPGEAAEKAAHGRAIYNRMKQEHPFLTSSEDSVFAVLMAFSGKDDDALVADMEACYKLLKRLFPSGDALQSVSHVLAMAEGAPEDKVQRLDALYGSILAAGGKYGRYNELPILAALSIQKGDIQGMTDDLMEADAFLATQKGYGFFGPGKKGRMMHAAMIVSDELTPHGSLEAASLTSAMATIAAQQAAMCAIIASSSAAAASSASH